MDMCPKEHRLNRRERWCYGLSKNLHHASGEIICITCGKRRNYDITFNIVTFPEIRYSQRVHGEWEEVNSFNELVWED